ncbi:hypothetical protein NIES2109_64870 (plasmid) [Nostoc sp. HK-01]|nr:hypothetical protein NIES2109_64870 [Nostoc sp. HK-01]
MKLKPRLLEFLVQLPNVHTVRERQALLDIGVNRRFVPPSAAYDYKPYTAIVTEIDTRFKRDLKKISCTNSCSSAEKVKELYLKRNLE